MLRVLNWMGCVGGIIGAFSVANEYRAGYIPFMIGALAYCVVAFNKRDYPLLLLNIVFASANAIGLYNWLSIM
jgi:nicotinamide riboside transporter PnuC